MLSGENSILTRAKDAKDFTIVGQEQDQIELAYISALANKQNTDITKAELQPELDALVGNDKTLATGINTLNVHFYDTNHNYSIVNGSAKRIADGEVEDIPSEIFVALYNNGTLVFSNNEEDIDSSKVDENYGDISNISIDYPWYGNTEITKVTILNKIMPVTTSNWFSELRNVIEIENISNINTSNVVDMSYMFYTCENLTSIDVSSFNTSNVTNFDGIFINCSKLTSLNLSNFDTSKATTMMAMFCGCSSLTNLNINSFNTDHVTNMHQMFYDCSKLISINVSSFNTSNVTSMNAMFQGCSSLTTLNLSNFNTTQVVHMEGMFSNCSSLTSLNLSSFNTSKVNYMTIMFSGCSSLTTLNLSNFNTSNVNDMMSMFENCSSLESVNLRGFNTENVDEMRNMFRDCSSLTTLDLSSFNTSNVADISWIFYNCSSLTTIYVTDAFITTHITSSLKHKAMFSNCTSLVGGNGTTYNSSYTNKTYARIDTNSTPGYFTLGTN